MDINNLGECCGSKTIEVKKIKNMVEREEEEEEEEEEKGTMETLTIKRGSN